MEHTKYGCGLLILSMSSSKTFTSIVSYVLDHYSLSVSSHWLTTAYSCCFLPYLTGDVDAHSAGDPDFSQRCAGGGASIDSKPPDAASKMWCSFARTEFLASERGVEVAHILWGSHYLRSVHP